MRTETNPLKTEAIILRTTHKKTNTSKSKISAFSKFLPVAIFPYVFSLCLRKKL